MSRKDFELIAKTIKDLGNVLTHEQVEIVAMRFAQELQYTNNLFNFEKFYTAIGVY